MFKGEPQVTYVAEADELGALRVYAFSLGALLVVLSALREPTVGKLIPTGVLLGGTLIGATIPMGQGPAEGVVRIVDRIRLFFVVALAALFLLPPGVALIPAVAWMTERLGEAAAGALLTSVFGLGVTLWLAGFVFGILLPLGTVASWVMEPGRRTPPRRELMVPLLCVVGAGVAMLDGEPLRWVRPPISLGWTPLLLMGGLAGLTYHAIRQRWTDRSSLTWLALAIAAAAGVSLARPGELMPPRVQVQAARGELESETLEYVREAIRRTGIDAHGEDFIVEWAAAPPTPNEESLRTYDRRAVRITITADLPQVRRRNFALYQLSAALVDLRVGVGDPGHLRGYAYWSANNPFNPFVTGQASGFSPHVECAKVAAPSGDLDSSSALHSLPFVLAEREADVSTAQRLFARVHRDGVVGGQWLERIAADCETFLARYAEPDAPEISVDPSATSLISEDLARTALEVARGRSGLDSRGRPILIRSGQPPGGSLTHSEFLRERTTITVSPRLDGSRIEEALVYQIVGIFITAHHSNGTIDPVRGGFASWASREPTNPFVIPTSSADGRRLCSDRSYLAKPATSGAVYLSSLPFVLAERDAGVAAAQQLLRTALAGGFNVEAWAATVASACERYQGAGS